MQKKKASTPFCSLPIAKEKQNRQIVRDGLHMRTLSRKELEAEIPEVDKYFGKFNYTNILTLIWVQEFRADLRNERSLTTRDIMPISKFQKVVTACSYCAIPLITGRTRSQQNWKILRRIF